MRRIDYSELFVAGRKIKSGYGDAALNCHDAGDLVLPTGKIVACDPAVSPDAPPFAVCVAPGKYPVILSVAHYGGDQRVAYAMLKFGDERPARWGAALPANRELTSPKADEVYYYGVDSATGCYMDVEAARVLSESAEGDIYFDQIAEGMDKTYVETWSWANICLNPATGANIVCFSTGLGDGAYASYFGYGGKGDILCLVTDFRLFEDKELRRWFL